MADTPMKVVVDCSAPNKERELEVAQAGIGGIIELVRAGRLPRDLAEAKVRELLDHASEIVAAPEQVAYLPLDADDLAQREQDHLDARVAAVAQLEADCHDRLRSCDWTLLPDAGLTAAKATAWATYRKAVRELPGKTTDPFNPDWPEPPA